MKHLNDTIYEALLEKPMVEDGKVKVIALVTDSYMDDNLNLIKGRNRVCLIWSPDDGNGYMCANGGKSFGDGLEWISLIDIDKIVGKLGKQKWRKIGDEIFTYSYWSTVGKPREQKVTAYFAELTTDELNKIYNQNGKTLWIYKRGYSTAKVKKVIDDWKKEGYLG